MSDSKRKEQKNFGWRRLLSICVAVILAGAMFYAIPFGDAAYADTNAGPAAQADKTGAGTGGDINTNDPTAYIRALGEDNVEVSVQTDPQTSASVVTVQLKKNIILDEPIKLVMATSGDRVIFDLNSHTMTGPAGKSTKYFRNSAINRLDQLLSLRRITAFSRTVQESL